jgi:hypothetical protein
VTLHLPQVEVLRAQLGVLSATCEAAQAAPGAAITAVYRHLEARATEAQVRALQRSVCVEGVSCVIKDA